MQANKFPIGETLLGVSLSEYTEFNTPELCLEQLQLIFAKKIISLRPLEDSDEIEVAIKPYSKNVTAILIDDPFSLKGKKLQSVWLCENNQGYLDQIIFAFDNLQPTIAFVAEGSVLKVFRFEAVLQKQPMVALVGSNGTK